MTVAAQRFESSGRYSYKRVTIVNQTTNLFANTPGWRCSPPPPVPIPSSQSRQTPPADCPVGTLACCQDIKGYSRLPLRFHDPDPDPASDHLGARPATKVGLKHSTRASGSTLSHPGRCARTCSCRHTVSVKSVYHYKLRPWSASQVIR